MIFNGYEFGYQCPKCDQKYELCGVMVSRKEAIINGEIKRRVREITPGDVLKCSNCGYEYEI